MKKIISIVSLVLVLCLGTVGIFAFGTGAEENAPSLSLDYANLSFRDSITIKFAVRAEGADGVSLLCWTAPEEDYVKGTEDRAITVSTTETIEGQDYLVFDYNGLAAKQMTDTVYVRAYAVVDGKAVYSNVRKYSALEYAYTVLGKMNNEKSSDAELCDLMEAMLAYGGAAQKYFDYATDRLASDPHYLVTVSGGTLSDGTAHGLYPAGATVALEAPAANAEGGTFSYWADANGNKVASDANCTVQAGAANATYAPVYVKYSVGLEFESNGDGTCILLGMGDCLDTEIVIPPTALEGDRVVEIDASAFAGEAITSVTFPTTIESIGRRAFNNCTALTTVIYEGTAAEWENVFVNATGNDAILNADVQFLGETKYTVTFVDWDGTVLKTESVASGKAATAPADPSRAGYTFSGWDKDFSSVTESITVTARYTSGKNVFTVESVAGAVGDTVTVLVSVDGEVKLCGFDMTLYYDNAVLELVSYDADLDLDIIVNADYLDNGVLLNFSAATEKTSYKEIISLNFRIKSTTANATSVTVEMTSVKELNGATIVDSAYDVVDGVVTIQ